MVYAAMQDVDFMSLSGDLTFSAGLEPPCVTVMILDDFIPELAETFRLRLTSSSIPRAVIVEPIATITITDSDRTLQCLWQVCIFTMW